jgi:glycosyltransferase involved in cell wall biosynthesis
MACSKPVVATNTGGPKEIVVDGETGFLVPLAQPNVLAQKLLTLLTDESLRKKMGEKARNTALACFSWHRISEKYHRLYKSLL